MSTPPIPPSLRSAAPLVAGLGLGQIVTFASSFYLMGVLGDPIAQSLGMAPTLLFALMSGSMLISGLAGPFTGRWLDARGGREVLLVSNLVLAAGLSLIAAARGPVSLAAGMGLLGAGMAVGLYGTPFKILVQLYGDHARRPITGVALLGGLGSSLGWPATLALEHALGWRGACLAWAAAQLLVCLPIGLWLVPSGRPARRDPAAEPPVAVAWDRRMVQLAVLFAGAWLVSTCMSAHLPRLLQALGLSRPAAVGVAALVGVAAVSARLLEFTVLRKLPPLATTRIACLLHPAGAAALLAFGSRAAPALALGQGAGNGMLSVANGVLPLALFGPERYGYRCGLINTPARLFQAAGPALYALILARSPIWALVFSSAICGVMALATIGLKRTAPEIG